MQPAMIAMFAGVLAVSTPDTVPMDGLDSTTSGLSDQSVIDELTRDIEALASLEESTRDEIAAASENLLRTTDRAIIWNTSQRGTLVPQFLLGVRGWALWNLDRIDEADLAFEQAGPRIAHQFEYLDFRHDLAWDQQDWDRLLDILEMDSVAAAAGDALIHLYANEDLIRLNARLGRTRETSGRIAEIVLATDWGSDLPPGDRDWILVAAAKSRHARDDLEGARRVIAQIERPSELVDLMILARYSDLHSDIARLHGPDLSTAVQSFSQRLGEASEQDPENPAIHEARVRFFSSVGNQEGIDSVIAPYVGSLDTAGEFNDVSFWIVNTAALSMARQGRLSEAIGLLDQLLAQGVTDHPVLVNATINRLLLLNYAERHEEALAGALVEAHSDFRGASPFGKMFIMQSAACAAHYLGDVNQANEWRAQVEENGSDNSFAHFGTLICFNDLDAAAAIAVSHLESDNPASILYLFQDTTVEQQLSEWQQEMRARTLSLLERTEVSEALNRAGRVIQFAIIP